LAAVGRAAWLQAVVDALCDLSSQDPLTGLANRRHFELALEREIDRVARAGEPALVLMVDIDHFKRVNDSFGHAVGDLVLKSVAHVLQGCIRPMDIVSRIGGEEFAIILPNCPLDFGQTAAERVRMKVQTRSVLVAPGHEVSVTVSIGGAFAPKWTRVSAQHWLSRADQQLYLAKSEGRNRARLEEPLEVPSGIDTRPALFDTSWFHEVK
jgi:diguanylate cyclase (GGDEF)-like protein